MTYRVAVPRGKIVIVLVFSAVVIAVCPGQNNNGNRNFFRAPVPVVTSAEVE